MAEHVNYNINS